MLKGLFFDSVKGDRVYDSQDFASYFSSLVTTGVLPKPADSLKVEVISGMEIKVLQGACIIDGKVGIVDVEPHSFLLQESDTAYPRVDRVVMRLNKTNRKFEIIVLKGATAASPKGLDPVREGGIYDLVLADIFVLQGTTEIRAIDITDLRDSEYNYFAKATFDPVVSSGALEDLQNWINTAKSLVDANKVQELETAINALNLKVNMQEAEIQDFNTSKMDNVEIVNDLTTGGVDKILSAEQGKVLFQSVSSGKSRVATAITDKGISVEGCNTLTDLAARIDGISGMGYGTGEKIPKSLLTYYSSGIDVLRSLPISSDILAVSFASRDKIDVITKTKFSSYKASFAENTGGTFVLLNDIIDFQNSGIEFKGFHTKQFYSNARPNQAFLCSQGLLVLNGTTTSVLYPMTESEMAGVIGIHAVANYYGTHYYICYPDRTIVVKSTGEVSTITDRTILYAFSDVNTSSSSYKYYYFCTFFPSERIYKLYRVDNSGVETVFFTSYIPPVYCHIYNNSTYLYLTESIINSEDINIAPKVLRLADGKYKFDNNVRDINFQFDRVETYNAQYGYMIDSYNNKNIGYGNSAINAFFVFYLNNRVVNIMASKRYAGYIID